MWWETVGGSGVSSVSLLNCSGGKWSNMQSLLWIYIPPFLGKSYWCACSFIPDHYSFSFGKSAMWLQYIKDDLTHQYIIGQVSAHFWPVNEPIRCRLFQAKEVNGWPLFSFQEGNPIIFPRLDALPGQPLRLILQITAVIDLHKRFNPNFTDEVFNKRTR